mmetsp:Transcript_9292/g.32691  ORF Transcript_9292/g.32691 Transcript_9292/m.32691 type:complete len:587 (+) Transcript_9292:84-1844(+)
MAVEFGVGSGVDGPRRRRRRVRREVLDLHRLLGPELRRRLAALQGDARRRVVRDGQADDVAARIGGEALELRRDDAVGAHESERRRDVAPRAVGGRVADGEEVVRGRDDERGQVVREAQRRIERGRGAFKGGAERHFVDDADRRVAVVVARRVGLGLWVLQRLVHERRLDELVVARLLDALADGGLDGGGERGVEGWRRLRAALPRRVDAEERVLRPLLCADLAAELPRLVLDAHDVLRLDLARAALRRRDLSLVLRLRPCGHVPVQRRLERRLLVGEHAVVVRGVVFPVIVEEIAILIVPVPDHLVVLLLFLVVVLLAVVVVPGGRVGHEDLLVFLDKVLHLLERKELVLSHAARLAALHVIFVIVLLLVVVGGVHLLCLVAFLLAVVILLAVVFPAVVFLAFVVAHFVVVHGGVVFVFERRVAAVARQRERAGAVLEQPELGGARPALHGARTVLQLLPHRFRVGAVDEEHRALAQRPRGGLEARRILQAGAGYDGAVVHSLYVCAQRCDFVILGIQVRTARRELHERVQRRLVHHRAPASGTWRYFTKYFLAKSRGHFTKQASELASGGGHCKATGAFVSRTD